MVGATSPTENRKRMIELHFETSAFPLRVDAHSLPFANEFCDAAIAVDSFLHFGMDERYLRYLIQFIKPGGFIGVVDIAFTARTSVHRGRAGVFAPAILETLIVCAQRWSGGSGTARKWGSLTCNTPSICPRAMTCYATMCAIGRPNRMRTRSCGWCLPRDHEGLIALFCLVTCQR